jgi:hypothetical protein
MKKDKNTQTNNKKKLVLRKQSIRKVDDSDLIQVVGGDDVPPDGGCTRGGQ